MTNPATNRLALRERDARVVANVGRLRTFTPDILFMAPLNLSGQPAISLPLHWTREGLPLGTHFIGRIGEDATLLRLAGQMETALPWKSRRPPVSL